MDLKKITGLNVEKTQFWGNKAEFEIFGMFEHGIFSLCFEIINMP